MKSSEMAMLKIVFGDDLKFSKAYHLHDEDEWNEIDISYRGIIVGSELVEPEFVWDNIKAIVFNERRM